ncbi:MAG: hypothetical protein ACRC7S_17240 [Cetobacterium sp.]
MHFFNEKLAGQFGVYESLFLQNLYYILKQRLLSEKVDENLNPSITMSRTKILEHQEYFSDARIRRVRKNLLDLNIIETCQKHKRVSNSLTYSLTLKGWILMIALEKKSERKNIYKSLVNLTDPLLSKFIELLLIKAEVFAKLTEVRLISTELDAKLADIIIEYRNLIEKDRKIEKTAIDKKIVFENEFSETINPNFENKIEEIISGNSIFKKRVEKTFLDSQKFNEDVLLPMITKYGYLKVLKALKKTVEEFLPSNSPVANFYTNLTELNA